MNPSQQLPAAEPQAPFPGHPFGGLPRDGGLNLKTSFEDLHSFDSETDADVDEGAGFDFHLGVYSKF